MDAAAITSIAEGAAVGKSCLRLFAFDEMETMLKQCGFSNVERFGVAEVSPNTDSGNRPRTYQATFG